MGADGGAPTRSENSHHQWHCKDHNLEQPEFLELDISADAFFRITQLSHTRRLRDLVVEGREVESTAFRHNVQGKW